ncbi:MAG: hypothetical protein IH956_07110 [Chloroflexi bacterium]|nr:hypothetical protein [Chloroflexota bacterium]
MDEVDTMSMDEFRARISAAGLELTEEEVESLKPMFDLVAGRVARIHELDLGAEDLALVFRPETD